MSFHLTFSVPYDIGSPVWIKDPDGALICKVVKDLRTVSVRAPTGLTDTTIVINLGNSTKAELYELDQVFATRELLLARYFPQKA